MNRQQARGLLVRAGLLLPVLLFTVLFFAMPLLTVMEQAVSDAAVYDALPATAQAAKDWDRQSPPLPLMKAALVQDLRAIEDPQVLGDVVRRLNSAQPGFRTLLARTTRALEDEGGEVDLAAIDRRWDQPAFWQAIVAALSPYTDRNLLAAIDMERDPSGQIVAMPSGASANRSAFVRTFLVSGTVTAVCLLIGYPYAMLLAAASGWIRQVLIAAVLLPLWTSLLVRTAAWYILLQDQGFINSALRAIGLIEGSVHLLFSRTGVIIAMTHVLLPFMVLPIYSVLLTIPKELMPAAASLGAGPLRSFIHVQLPLSLRGLASGSLLVFMAATGYYITPALIGGPRDQMISSVIAFYALGSANWGMAAALGLFLLATTLILYALFHRLSNERAGSF